MGFLYLSKAIIKNFRSIESLYLNNIGDITILIGPNESGKSNILLALKWFGTDEPLSNDDRPVDKKVKDNEVIISLYFKIIDKSQFWEALESKINEELKDFLTSSMKLSESLKNNHSPLFLKIQKHADGSFHGFILNESLKDITKDVTNDIIPEVLHYIDFSKLFYKSFEEILKDILSNIFTEQQILSAIATIKKNSNFLPHLQSISRKLSSLEIKSGPQELISNLDAVIQDVVRKASTTSASFTISGKSFSLNPQDIFNKAFSKTKESINSFENCFKETVQKKLLKRIKPSFVYLKEEMELKGKIKKEESWSSTLKEDNEKYIINSRLFSILEIDLSEFDKKSPSEQSLELKNRLIEFSKRLAELWRQQRLRIETNIDFQEIALQICELDKENNLIKYTFPEMRSRGFKWYLAYLITLEYLKRKENTILLLDDPAVFLHEKGQKDFLKTIEDISKNVQIFYSTHLVSLFDERELDRVILIELDNGHKTIAKKPWTNRIEEVAAPVYHALGFDKLIFERNIEKVLFVEGISDKFILEGLQSIDNFLKNWYIHPLSAGGKKLEENELIRKLKLLYLLENKKFEYRFILDGDRKKEIENAQEVDSELKKKILFLGKESQEIEDLINKNFYLDCMLECYKNIFLDNLVNLEKIKKIVEELKQKSSETKKITKKIDEKFKNANLGGFSKVIVAILIKRKIRTLKPKDVKEKFSELFNYLNDVLKKIEERK